MQHVSTWMKTGQKIITTEAHMIRKNASLYCILYEHQINLFHEKNMW